MEGQLCFSSPVVFYRFIVVGIVLFWLAMTAQLVREEVWSGWRRSQPVPVDFVVRLMFHHEEVSDLTLFSHGHRLDGNLHLQPRRLPAGQDQAVALDCLTWTGSFALNLPGVDVNRVVLRGLAEITDEQRCQRLELTASLHEPRQNGPGLTLFLEGRPGTDAWHYVVRQAGTVVHEDAGPMLQLLRDADPHLPGISFEGIEQMQRQTAASTSVTAYRDTLRLGGEAADTYVISLRQGDVEEASVHFNQLGQILAIKTFTGYDLYDEGVAPGADR